MLKHTNIILFMYDNVKLFSKSGEFLNYTCRRKALWYVKKGLAVEQEDGTYKLNHDPEKKMTNKKVEDFMKQPKENICVLCGSQEDIKKLTCIIPGIIRKHFPNNYTRSKAHTFVPICDICKPDVDSFQHTHCNEIVDEYKKKYKFDNDNSKKFRELANILINEEKMTCDMIEKYWADIFYNTFLPPHMDSDWCKIYGIE
jgi:hypothetical protein